VLIVAFTLCKLVRAAVC